MNKLKPHLKCSSTQKAGFFAAATLTAMYSLAFTSFALADWTGDITTFFNNIQKSGYAIWAGVCVVVGLIVLIAVSKDLVPALLNKRKMESPEFKDAAKSALVVVIATLMLALAPTWVPSLIEFFGGANSIVSSFSAASGSSS